MPSGRQPEQTARAFPPGLRALLPEAHPPLSEALRSLQAFLPEPDPPVSDSGARQEALYSASQAFPPEPLLLPSAPAALPQVSGRKPDRAVPDSCLQDSAWVWPRRTYPQVLPPAPLRQVSGSFPEESDSERFSGCPACFMQPVSLSPQSASPSDRRNFFSSASPFPPR